MKLPINRKEMISEIVRAVIIAHVEELNNPQNTIESNRFDLEQYKGEV